MSRYAGCLAGPPAARKSRALIPWKFVLHPHRPCPAVEKTRELSSPQVSYSQSDRREASRRSCHQKSSTVNTACQAKSLKLLQVAANRHFGDGEYLGKFARLDGPPCFERRQDGMRAFRHGGIAHGQRRVISPFVVGDKDLPLCCLSLDLTKARLLFPAKRARPTFSTARTIAEDEKSLLPLLPAPRSNPLIPANSIQHSSSSTLMSKVSLGRVVLAENQLDLKSVRISSSGEIFRHLFQAHLVRYDFVYGDGPLSQ